MPELGLQSLRDDTRRGLVADDPVTPRSEIGARPPSRPRLLPPDLTVFPSNQPSHASAGSFLLFWLDRERIDTNDSIVISINHESK